MERSCHRPGCRRFVASALAYDIPRRIVWLEDVEFDESVERRAERDGHLLLCSLHSDRFQVPVGWELIDQRSPARSLWTHQAEELPRRTLPPATPKTKSGRGRKSASEPADSPHTFWDVESPEESAPGELGSDESGSDRSGPDEPGPDEASNELSPDEPKSMRLLDRDHPPVDGESLGISFDADSPLLRRAFLAALRAS